MKKIVLAALLAVASSLSMTHVAVAQTQPNLGTGGQGGIQLSPAEYTDYTAAIGQTTPQTKAPALEAYLTKYPQSQVKADVMMQLVLAYAAFDPTKAMAAADKLLQVDPNNLAALYYATVLHKASADQITDATQKQAALDAAAGYAQRGLQATKPKDMTDADFTKEKSAATQFFYSAIATAAAGKGDNATAITNFKAELESVPVDQTKVPGPLLQDTYYLGQAYYQSKPPDYVNCTWYMTRAADFAPEPYKTQMSKVASYCYKKYHGADDGYDAVVAAAQASLEPPAGFSIKPAPSPADIVAQVIATTPDLGGLAIDDKEFILQNGKPDDAAKVFDAVKGKATQLPGVVVVSATANQILGSVSTDAVQGKTADFTFNFTDPLKTVPNAGDKLDIQGTYASFTANPVMIIMSDSSVVEPKKAKPAPVKKPAARRPAAH